ncbi:TipJ family phage tail tip protein [Gilliamella apis]|uniref:Host specificity protein n=2 Tax=Orbaceae TaxID=1240483 RepID=A0A2V4DSG1_9GAMM|nr:DUF1983 domain-containing protein [Gilliamella apis]PXY92034.1 host specificity protein [Gilliamella apis]WLS92950.1 DUF1983 domain-containing protein [Gilliamella apis]
METQIIEGQKGGSKKPHNPYEQPDNLLSTAKLKMLIALSEGEIEGSLTAQNIFIDKTPLANPDGTYNFKGVHWEFRNGSQTQDYIQGMPEVSNELKANFAVKTDMPWVRSFSNLELDAVRIKLSLPSHVSYRDNGDMVGTTTHYTIDLSVDGSAFETVLNGKFDGKTTSAYQRDHRIDLPNAIQGWTIRVRRITPDSKSSKLVNAFGVSSYAEVIDNKLRYPNTALLYVELDASEFNGSVPLVTCKLKGKVVQVPDNYDPVSRTYFGEWNGTFKMAYTNNPAWIAHYLMRDEIAGMGTRIESSMIDKWAIYQLGQYCDQMVSDGKGGKEPRFTCNEYIQSQRDAYAVLKDLVASFRGITFWGNDQIYLTSDMPQDEPDFIYHPSNVIGDIVYAGGSYKNRYTSCLVAYSNPDNHYCDDVETVWDNDLMRRYDVNVMKLTAIGCTSQSEAQRRGRWALLSNVKDGVVTFSVGLDGYIPLPARIIGIADPSRSGKENGGRIHEVNGRKITLDRPVDYDVGDRLVINLPDGTAQSRTIKSISKDKRTVTVTANYKVPPVAGAVWCIDSDNVAIQYYRVTSISAKENQQFTITAVQHDPEKFKYIDNGVRLEPKPITVTPSSTISAPKNIVISESSYVSQGLSVASLEVNWDKVDGAINYIAQWRKDKCTWINTGQTNGTSFTVNGIYSGVYDVRVRAVNAVETSSPWAYSEATAIKGKIGKPEKPVNFTASEDVIFGIDLNWSFPKGSGDTSHTEIQYSTNENEENALLLSNVPYPSYSHSQTGLSIGQVFFYRARLVDKIGNTSDWTDWVRGISSTNTNDLTDHIFNEIKETDAWNSLVDSIDNVVNNSIDNAKAIIENALANDIETKQRRIENSKLSAEIKETNAVLLSEKEATSIALKELHSKYGNVSSDLSELRQTTAEQNSATSKSIDSLTAKVGNVSSDLSQFKQVTTNQNSATAQAIQSINTKVGDVSTSISDVSKTVNNLDGKVSAQRSIKVKVDSKGQQYAAGMSIGVENTDKGMQSNIIFLQDRFSIMNAAGGNPQPIFTTHGNQVVINEAVIGNGTITDAKIKNASITSAKISNVIQSDNFIDNVSGWQLSRDNGRLKAVNAEISGKLRATSGEMDNVVINENCQIKGTLNVNQIKGNVLSTKLFKKKITIAETNPNQKVHVMNIEASGEWQTLCFIETIKIRRGKRNIVIPGNNLPNTFEHIRGNMRFLFNDLYPYEVNKFYISNIGFHNLILPIPPFSAGERVEISLTINKPASGTIIYDLFFDSLVFLMKNSNGFLSD